jgi:hypothetical protein
MRNATATRRPTLTLTFRGGEVGDEGMFALRYVAKVGGVEREVSVLVERAGAHPRLRFPHLFTDTGQSLGSDALDAAVIERARITAAALDAAGRWSRWRS